ncbi:beta-ketoacyl synthase N-terminal-like domain-containing protein [Planctomycetaceae bacterium SH139]
MSPERSATFNRSASQLPIAITGLGCRLPGCNSPAEYWEMILAGECRVAPAPAERFDRDLYYYPERGELNRSYTDLACTIDYRGAAPTHPSLPASVRSCPELAFTTLYLAVDQALRGDQQFGQAAAVQSLPSRTGVYVGHTRKSGLAGQMIVGTYIPQIIQYLSEVNGISDEQRERVAESLRRRFRDAAPRRSAAGQPDLTSLTAAGLISQGLGLDGPAMVFNSACASSLQALAQAVRALQLGTIDAAIVGSASYFHADTLVLFSQAQSLSAVGSHPFDISADGIVVGEGYAAVVLRREEDAIAAQLPRHATIRGVGISSDGKGKSLWAPRAEGQKLAVARAYSGIADSHAPQYIEAHATGTQLGDATELTAIAASLQSRQIEQPIAVGSVKSNIGHTLETAGLAGLIKAVLSVREGVIPPTTGVSQLNPKIDWETIPFHIPTWAQTWPELAPAVPRRAAINAFGIGGLNVHVVIDAAQASPPQTKSPQLAIATVKQHSHSAAGSPNRTASLSRNEPDVEQIAIVGMGMIAAGCANVEAFWQRLAAGEAALRDVPPTRWRADLFCDPQHVRPWHTTTTRGGYVTEFSYDWRRHRIPPKQIAHASPVQFMVLEAVEQALKQSFGEELQHAGGLNQLAERTGVIVGTTFGGDFANQLLLGLRLPEFEQTIRHTITDLPSTEVEAIVDQFHDTVLRHMPALLDETGSFTSSSLASRITKTFDLFGGAVAVDGGLCSAAASLQCAVDLLRSGDNDMMICVAAQEDMSPTRFELMSLSGDLAATPEGHGLVPGEGCVAFVLRRLSDAERDQQPILGRIGAIDAHFDHTRRATRPPTPAQCLIGHTLGAAGHIELLSALAPQAPHPPSTQVESADFSGLHYKIELFCAKYSIDEAQSATNSPAIQTHVMAPRQDSKILQFDATQRRKLRLRERAMSGKQPQSGSSATPPSTTADQPLNPPPQQPTAAQPIAAQPVAAHFNNEINGHPQPTPAGLPPAKLRQLLVDFVVDQTGYPTDMVELDADLEADLGLDSIKKAQLLGEVGEHYALADRNDVDLDKLNTLAAIEAFLLALPTGSPTENPMGSPTSSTQPLASFPDGNVTSRPSKNGSSHAEHTADPQQPVQQQPVPSGVEPRGTANELRAAVELRMISFVVDQTGYPPDMVELDADLEADLGIDSIRKAQLLGELAETFGLQADEATSLDELPSLRAILDFTCQQLADNAPPAQGTQQPSAHPVAPAPAPVPQAAVPAAQAPVSQTPASVSGTIDAGLLREKMIEFVVEQTGYPLEMVELDADLEADLGIDSIKKAQLMGELQETYQFATRDDMTLDDFPDLASIERFVLEMCAPQGSVARSRF